MTVTVRLAAPLRAAAGGNTTIDFDVTDLPQLASEIVVCGSRSLPSSSVPGFA